ncbi:response regulator transcription factor [Streptomyces sp. NPDC006193]|uniref:response regulator transcription factor n=1 Tax=Streptomyces sp. NPDC006193 TaxID=3155717 RepID=UPI0033AD2D91
MTSPSIRIVIADDHSLVRDALSELLGAQAGIAVVGHAASCTEVVRVVRALRPDLVLLDLRMAGRRGGETVRRIRRAAPATQVLVLSARSSARETGELLAAGAGACLHKRVGRGELLRAIDAACAGRSAAVPPTPADGPCLASSPPPSRPAADFSLREREILGCVASAMSNRQIAAVLGVTEGTVKRHLHNVYRKLGAVSRVDAVNKAVAASLIPDRPPLPATGAGRTATVVAAAVRPAGPGSVAQVTVGGRRSSAAATEPSAPTDVTRPQRARPGAASCSQNPRRAAS